MDALAADADLVYEKTKVPLSEEKKQWLKKYNFIAGILHLFQAIMQLICGLMVDNFKNFKLPVRLNYLKTYETPDGSRFLFHLFFCLPAQKSQLVWLK